MPDAGDDAAAGAAAEAAVGAGRRDLLPVLLLLLAAGWAANHFAALIPVLRRAEDLPAGVLEGAFGIYALGLLPGLLGGGALSDRLGRRPLVLTGSTIAAGGNLLILGWHTAAGVYAGRLVVGLGVGLAISAGTAWAADLAGRRGATVAGVTLTAGFATGPLVSGLLAQPLPAAAALTLPFALTVALSLTAVAVGLRTSAPPVPGDASVAPATAGAAGPEGRVGTALAAAVPMALWVFSTVTVPIVVLVARMQDAYGGPWLPGVASAVTLGSGVLVQVIARRRRWDARAGVVGAGLAAVGFAIAAGVGASPSLLLLGLASVVLGTAYGLCLREGLLDVEALAPATHRGLTLGVFYVCTYLGFALPVLLEAVRPRAGTVAPLLVLAALALVAAAIRTAQLRLTHHLDRRHD